jgi:hypothetical protein
VHGIAVEENDLVIGTHGRSFWILPNIGVLREMGPDVTRGRTYLYTPADVVRAGVESIGSIWRGGGGFGGGGGRGASIDYYLASDAESVSIAILDSSGAVIRSYANSAEDEKKREQAQGEEEPSFGGPRARVGLKKGHNRLIWDLRHADAATVPGLILWAGSTRGPRAAPGRYQVRLTVDDESLTRTFAVKRDPRLTGVSDADLVEQFTLAKQISDRVSEANATVVRIRQLKEQIAERLAKINATKKDARVTSAADAVTKRLTEIEGEIYQYRNKSSQDPLNYPIKLNNKLAALQGVVESADAKPTDQSYEVFKDLSTRLDAEFRRLDAVLKTDLVGLNKMFTSRRLEAVR